MAVRRAYLAHLCVVKLFHRLSATGSQADVQKSLVKVQALLGKVSHDLRDHYAALIHLHVAAEAAPSANDSELQAWVHNLESLVTRRRGGRRRGSEVVRGRGKPGDLGGFGVVRTAVCGSWLVVRSLVG